MSHLVPKGKDNAPEPENHLEKTLNCRVRRVANRVGGLVVFVDGVVSPILHIDRPNPTQQKLETSFIKLSNCLKGDNVMETPARKQYV